MKEDTATTTETMHCARHPGVETGLTCAKCGTPICPKCMAVTPVGMKCPDCGRAKDSPLFKIAPERFVLAGVVALIAGVAAALIGELGFFVIFLSVPYGYFAGSMIMRASGMKRGAKLGVLAGVGIVLGAVAFKLLPALLVSQQLGEHGESAFATVLPLLTDLFFWISVVISTSCAVSKIRYL